jgi:hypothetical protein
MRRIVSIVAVVLVLVVIVVAGVIVTQRDDGRVYSAREVQAGLRYRPHWWLGRNIQVHGTIVPYFTANYGVRLILGPINIAQGPATPNPLLTWLRGQQFLDRVIPEDQPVLLGQVATFHIEIIDAFADPRCRPLLCYHAQLFGPPPGF